ncbi:MAG: hypothetical protein FNT15_03445 [Sulfurovum sp.]|nr:MAG: hypothetical protein FNT15_03445 [Sulfurovum sp.]
MKNIKKFLTIVLLFATPLMAKTIDATTGLVVDTGLSDIKENCTVCHFGRFIVVNGGDKTFWNQKINQMQQLYGVWDIEPAKKERMLDYLSKHYSNKSNVNIAQ